MAINYKKIWNGVTVVPKTTTASSLLGELETLTSDNKIYFHNGTSNSPIVTEAHASTLTNKTIVVANNTITTAASGNLTATELNAALAELDSDITAASGGLAAHIADPTDAHDASAISVVPTGNLAATEVQAALVEHQGDIDTINTTLTNKVTGPASATDEALARFDGTTGKLVQNSVVTVTDAGVAAGLTGLTSSGTVSSTGTLAIAGNLTEALTTDAATTGANATITNPATSFLRLTNASLTSVDMISAPVAGEVITIVNATGVDITINNDLGGTAANRILTGTKANLTLKDEASIIVKYDSTESRWMVIGGTGAGSGSGINYILSSDGGSTTGWATYADAAAAIPVDGTGGSPNVTFATTTSAPLVGTSSFLFTKDAANRQGQGVSYAFTIDSGYQAQVLRISFPYSASANYLDTISGNLVNSDMQVFVYDVTNSQLIYVTEQNIGASSQGQYVGSFQTSSNSTSYRLILHVASTNATSYTLKLDNVVVGPQTLIKGAVDTFLGQLTTTGSWVTNTTYTFNYWRRGDRLIADGVITLAGAPTSTNLNINIPSGLSIDSTKTSITTDANYLGSLSINDSGTTYYPGRVRGSGTTTNLRLMFINSSSVMDNITQAQPMTFGSGDTIFVRYEVPILGWSSNLQLSEDTGNKLIAASARLSTTTIANANTPILFTTIDKDETASFTNTTFTEYTVPETGWYDVSYSLFANIASGTTSFWGYVLVDNSTGARVLNDFREGDGTTENISLNNSGPLYLTKGQTLRVGAQSAGTTFSLSSLSGSAADANFFKVAKIATPQTLAGSETVAARYVSNSAQAVVSGNTIVYEDKIYDTHNAYNASTGIWTCPASGYYNFENAFETAAFAGSIGNYVTTSLVNITTGEAVYLGLTYVQNTSNIPKTAWGSTTMYCSKSNTVKFSFTENSAATNLTTDILSNFMSITKVG